MRKRETKLVTIGYSLRNFLDAPTPQMTGPNDGSHAFRTAVANHLDGDICQSKQEGDKVLRKGVEGIAQHGRKVAQGVAGVTDHGRAQVLKLDSKGLQYNALHSRNEDIVVQCVARNQTLQGAEVHTTPKTSGKSQTNVTKKDNHDFNETNAALHQQVPMRDTRQTRNLRIASMRPFQSLLFEESASPMCSSSCTNSRSEYTCSQYQTQYGKHS